MAAEGTVQRQIWLALGAACRLFRVNTGKAWLSGTGPAKRMQDGSMLVPAARPVALGFGLPNGDPLVGASDLCGWTSVTITPDMIGQKVAVFTAVETKRTKGGKASEAQTNFVDQVAAAGGIAGVANSPEAAQQILSDWARRSGANL